MITVMQKTNVHIAALTLTGSLPGIIDTQIRTAYTEGNPINIDVLKEALAIECRSFGTRDSVVNTLRREVARQEAVTL